MNALKKLFVVLKDRRALLSGILAGAIFIVLYLWSIQHLSFSLTESKGLSFTLAENIQEKIFQLRAPFLWEPTASLNFFVAELFISPLNLFIGIILALLVVVNISIAVFSYKYRKVCNPKAGSSFPLAGVLPSMLTGFACCAPTFIIALAPVLASFTVFFIEIQKFLLPTAFLIMTLGAWFSLKRLPLTEAFSKNLKTEK